MTIGSLFMVHRSPFSASQLADFFSILWEARSPFENSTRIPACSPIRRLKRNSQKAKWLGLGIDIAGVEERGSRAERGAARRSSVLAEAPR